MGRPFTDFEELGMRVASAQKMVGYATISMDPDLLHDAVKTVEEARSQLEQIRQISTDLDEAFVARQEEMLQQCEHQLQEALR